jgi:hypothetical protein
MMRPVSTKWCHQCGSEFVARVEVCPDCGIELSVDPPGTARERPDAGGLPEHLLAEDGLEPGDRLVYELHDWSVEARQHLERLLSSPMGAGLADPYINPAVIDGPGDADLVVPHVWQGTDLVVPLLARERAEALIDQVEVTVMLALDPDAEKLAYDLSDLDEGALLTVSDALAAEGLPHDFDESTGELVVHEADEEKVEALLDAIDFPDALPVDEDGDDDDDDADVDPLAAQDVMSDLFVAADRLRKDARDHDGVLSVVEASARAAGLPTPYGFDAADWQAIVDRSAAVAALIEGDETDDETIEEAADGLRTLLRQYV